MEMRSENTEDISTFFVLLNEVLREVTGKEDYMFNPRCFMCDEGGANYNAIKNVWGRVLFRTSPWMPIPFLKFCEPKKQQDDDRRSSHI